MSFRRRVLFIAEAATLAHITRPLVLARSLEPAKYDIHFASADRYGFIFGQEHFRRWPLSSLPMETFLNRVAAGKPIFETSVLRDYIEQDRALLRQIKPEVVIGDLRLSLQVSARLERVPYFGLVNAYWSPFADPHYSVPDHPLVKLLGERVANAGFGLIAPLLLASHTLPMNRVRREHGLAILRRLQQVYCDADQVLYVDVPELIPLTALPPNHHYLGGVAWSPSTSLPSWWPELDESRPSIYVTVGSSGDMDVVPKILNALAEMPVNVMVATAGRTKLIDPPANVYVADYLPGLEAAARSSLVICNGGSPTTLQALVNGVPVIGIASNMDQFLNIDFVSRTGAGQTLRASTLNGSMLREACERLLWQPSARTQAQFLQRSLAKYDAAARLAELIDLHARKEP